MALIKVDTGQLVAAANRIDSAVSIGDQVASAQGRLYENASAAGSSAAAGSITTFLEIWGRGLASINRDGRALSRLLRVAAQSYDETEQAIADGASGR
jgi:hypothetical protein